MTTMIYGVGVGPGDPDLLTVRAVAVLHSVGAVMAPLARAGGESLALAIARTHLPADCEVLPTHLPMTEDRAVLEAAWDAAAALLLRHAAAGVPVAFITLGDAMLYSTWSYVLQAIVRRDAMAAVETVPGITAMSACAAAVGRPLAEGREPLLVWPDAPPADVAALLALAPNIVFMKADRHLAALAQAAESAGAEPVAVRRASQAGAHSTTDLRSWVGEHDYFTTVLMHWQAERNAPPASPGTAATSSAVVTSVADAEEAHS